MNDDFETHPIGTGKRLAELEGLAAQPPAVVLPTVDEVAEAILASPTSGEGWHVSGARAALDLIAARVPVWQPVEWEAIRPGMLIRGTRPGYRFELTVESIDRHVVCGVGGSVWMRTADGGAETATWEVDPRTVPAEHDPRVAVVIQWWRGSIEPMATTDKDAARDLLDRLTDVDAARRRHPAYLLEDL